ncbi:MAG: hypothetical protein EOO08_01145 [Chitinophagaceae bacterium]|nr:MAG: hypothetical protein EOO08_01145 [Chitinophagaceae bacterium]
MKLKLRPQLALPALFLLLLLSACRREESLETGYTSVFALQDTFGTCYGNNVQGVYHVGQATTDSNFLELMLYVANTGRYSINTDVQNGFSFTGTGAFTDTGMTTIRIPARGTPIAEGITTLRVAQDSGYCDINVTVLAAGVNNGGGTCNATATGSYKKDTALNASHTVTLQHNYTTAGTYTVTTDTVNGFYFNKAVTVSAPGTQTIILDGFGTPLATGTNSFTVDFGDGTDCAFSITVVQGTTGGGGGCGTLNGAYTVGTALTSANTFSSNSHVYSASGTYNVQVSSTAPGITATSASVTVTMAGTAPAITVPLAGTPSAAGTYPVTIDFGDGTTCSVNMTVNPVGGTTYFPMTQGSWWSYDEGAGDTLKITAGPMVTLGGNQYREFYGTYSAGDPDDTNHVRKDASSIFQQYSDLNQLIDFGGSSLVTFPPNSFGEIPLVKDFMTTGQSLVSPTFSGTIGGVPVNVRVTVVCTDANATVTANGNTFTNCYEMTTTYEFSTAGSPFQPNPLLPEPKTYFAPNIGLVQILPSAGMPAQDPIRYWQIQ